jgi:hypothetical protein
MLVDNEKWRKDFGVDDIVQGVVSPHTHASRQTYPGLTTE